MSIDFTTNYQNGSLTGQNQSTETPNLEALRMVFVAAMQNSLASRTPNSSTAILDMTGEIQDFAAGRKEEQNKDRHESMSQSERRDFTKEDQRTLNQSEIRHEQLKDDYVQKTERHENLRTEHQEKTERRDSITEPKIIRTETPFFETVSPVPVSSVPISVSNSMLPESFDIQPAASTPVSAPLAPGAVPPSFLIAGSNPIPVTSPQVVQSVTAFPVSAVPVAALDAVSVMTIFTASGRFGMTKTETEEKNATEKKKEKEKEKEKKGTISLIGQGFFETTQPIVYKNNTNDTAVETEPESNDDLVQKFGDDSEQNIKPKESEPESKKTEPEKIKQEENETKIPLEEWLSENKTIEKAVEKPNEPELFDRLRFIQRVTSACRSAANQNGTIRIKLHLDNLGSLTLRMTSKSNKLTVRFEVTSLAAVRLLRDSLNELQSTLAEQNIILEHTEINVT
jgi:hypothetical protein